MLPQAPSSSSSLSNKERQYAQLASQLDTLAHTFDTTKQHLFISADQAFFMRKLGLAQASIFMAVLKGIDEESTAAAESQYPSEAPQ